MLSIKDLHFGYANIKGEKTPIIKGLSAQIGEGEFVGLIGATGSGKSTLVSLIAGLQKPDSGTVEVDGRVLWDKGVSMRDIRFDVGLCFQYPEYQLFEETVFKDIAFGPKNLGLDESDVKERVHYAAEAVGLTTAQLEKSPFELSGGQKRRAALAGILAMRPKYLILDEPAAGLDPDGRENMLQLIERYHSDAGCSVLLVSHSMDDIAQYAQKVMVLSQGEIVLYDDMPTVFANAEQLSHLQLNVPQVTELFLQRNKQGHNLPTDVYTTEYAVGKLHEYLCRQKWNERID